jgi:hypothetical protein
MNLLDGQFAVLNTRLSTIGAGESVSLAIDPTIEADLRADIEDRFGDQFEFAYDPITEKNGHFRITAQA